jgi:uroporphyrinogen decarboxylase
MRAERFLKACRREKVDVTPVWMMRQAGRSLPAYRKLRESYSLVEITQKPELCAEVTLLPLKELDVDAAILFADIMLPLAGLGVGFELVEDVGPVIAEPINSRNEIEAMTSVPAAESVPSVLEAIRILRGELEGVVPLIGFSGAPFTLASYLVEGKPVREFAKTKALMFGEPASWHALMERLTAMIVDYLSEQVSAGVQAIQLFDSWVGALSVEDYAMYVLPYSKEIFQAMSERGVPRIHFGTGTSSLLKLMAAVDCEVVGVDWRVPLDVAWQRIEDRAIQGNLDPAVLLGSPELVQEKARDVLDRAAGRPGHIFNLGHGVLPNTPLGNLKLLVQVVHSYGAGR